MNFHIYDYDFIRERNKIDLFLTYIKIICYSIYKYINIISFINKNHISLTSFKSLS